MRNAFRKAALGDESELIFGKAKSAVRYGRGLVAGDGIVIPEIKFHPRRESEGDVKATSKEYVGIVKDLMEKAVWLGMERVQIETEFTASDIEDPGYAREVLIAQTDLLETYKSKYGISSALRVTVPDIRNPAGGMRNGPEVEKMFQLFEDACEHGADLVSMESIGGKEAFNHAILRQDLSQAIFSVAVLGSRDSEYIWDRIVRISRGHNVVPAGDSACGFANTAMALAGGTRTRMISHVFAAIIRAISAVRTLVPFEMGCVGPGKDCAYENVIVKAITGFPMSMEGKTAASAHPSLVGNVAMAACDLWSNEQVENVTLYGGKAPQDLLEMLSYDVGLLNASILHGKQSTLRDLICQSNKYLDPQALVLSPDVAWRLGKAIADSEPNDFFRAIAVADEALEQIELASAKMRLPEIEIKALRRFREEIGTIPDEKRFVETNIRELSSKLPSFNPRNYQL